MKFVVLSDRLYIIEHWKRVKMEIVLLDIGKYTGEVNEEGRPHGKGSLR